MSVVDLSRLQFALTALYHFLFVPLTLGLSVLLGIMESVYVMTGRRIWRDMTVFWGILFGINFAMGVATGITMEFQFGMNWSYYSQYVGDVFGAPLAIEGLMAFFLEATFIGLFFFGWDRLSKPGHLAVTWCVALGSNFSALWILVANAWMQNPVGSRFNPDTVRMEVTDFLAVIFNPVAQSKFVHTVAAGYVTGAMFVLSIGAYYLLRGRHVELARRSITVAASFGLASALSVVVLGDESGYVTTQNQKAKLAAIEAMWRTEPAPAAFTIFGIPDQDKHETRYALEAPWALGLIATRSLTQAIPGIFDLVDDAKLRIGRGVEAYRAMLSLQSDPANQAARRTIAMRQRDLGYAMLLRRYVDDPTRANADDINRAAWDTIPNVPALFWSFRIMVAIGFYFIALFAYAFVVAARRRLDRRKGLLRLALWSLPLPWIAAELGWIVAEYGRQPWIIEGVLPTFLAASPIAASNIWLSLAGFVVFYTALLVVDLYLLAKYVRLGPSESWLVPDLATRLAPPGGVEMEPRTLHHPSLERMEPKGAGPSGI
ncbi:cytochrome ubiquinol oxidase subunit I [Methylocystis heyeri]|uniref:Cytochrome bd-I ubiquinol oxidase subunit CydA n=1 Tax=Methylocystis heyeri TaxID=391905 RepID=A0A6B8KBT3_9HYPH|nr:cytochrome ubiquinol oxidase subunit I [Methylocystis heyeri]QGM45854.1 cytochrome bd-I ubiquinol oxidase subunit CydA [Methylocystis heyeri]